jgi:hypothetical protein
MIIKYLIGILGALNTIHVRTVLMKFKATIKLGILISPFALIMENFSRVEH